jgi:hypothetical protein
MTSRYQSFAETGHADVHERIVIVQIGVQSFARSVGMKGFHAYTKTAV